MRSTDRDGRDNPGHDRGEERSLVVTADDFGLSREVNEAVEIAHRDGILTSASLMVAEPWAEDAVARARRLPGLAVGLHLVLIEARPVLPPERIPDLVRAGGRLRTDLVRYGAEIFFRPAVKRQVAAEIEAQFQAYARTGLPLDHVNAHKHYHLHPTIAGLVISIGRRYGMRALRVPVEPPETLGQVEPVRRGLEARLAGPWAKMLRARARGAGLVVPDSVLGLAWSGAMTPDRVAGLIRNLPGGRTELYAHPAMRGGFEGEAPGYRYAEEFAALTAAVSRDALAASGATLSSYATWAGSRRSTA
jgi:hopanoid biosynthesis associated protein HpnK